MRLTLGRFFPGWLSDDNCSAKVVPPLVDMVEQAKKDWIFAQKYFNYVEDQDLIDYAVFLIMTTEKRYMYLLKKARIEGVTYSPFTMEPEKEACVGI